MEPPQDDRPDDAGDGEARRARTGVPGATSVDANREGAADDAAAVADEELMGRVQGGDTLAFESLVTRHEKRVIRFFVGRSRDRTLAEDLALEVWMKIYQARANYRPDAKFTTYMYRIMRNHWIDFMRVRANRPGRDVSLDQMRGDEHEAGLIESLATDTLSPEAERVNRELGDQIHDGVGACLSKGEADVFRLAIYDELKYAEVSSILDIPVGTVKSRMFTAMNKLKDWLEKRGLTP